MRDTSVTLTRTRYESLGIRYYRNVTCIGGGRKPHTETYYRFVDLSDGGDSDIGPVMRTKLEAFAALDGFARDRGCRIG